MRSFKHPFLQAFSACALMTGGCSAERDAAPQGAGSQPAATASASILSSSDPANGAKLRGAPTSLVLNFATPVRLAEVTVTGADGQIMPMMVSSAGANRRYELPLDGLENGTHSVRWRAIDEAGVTHEGAIGFEVR